jgi:hypothetical protein
LLATSLDGGSLCQSPRRSTSGWPGCALASTPGSKKSVSGPVSWCWPGRPPWPAAPQWSRSSRHRAGHRQRCIGHWLTRRGRLRDPCRCARRGLRRGHPIRGRPRPPHTAPARPARPATPRTPPPTSPPAGRAPTTDGAGACGHVGTRITSPDAAGGTTATASGMATARGTTVRADGTTAAGRTPKAGTAPATAIGKRDQAKQITSAFTTRVRCDPRLLANPNRSAPRLLGSAEVVPVQNARLWRSSGRGRSGCDSVRWQFY